MRDDNEHLWHCPKGVAKTLGGTDCPARRFPLSRGPLNQLYYGDNLQVLREDIATESVDLIYLDPRFGIDCALSS